MAHRRTLRESYERDLVTEKIQRAVTERIVAESAAVVLLEELNKDDFAKASKILKKLAAVKGAADKSGLSHLSDSIKKASDDLNSFTGGGWGAFLKKGFDVVAKKLGGTVAQKNPIIKCTLLLSVIEGSFSKIPQILDNVSIDKASDKSISDAEDEKASENARNMIAKSLVPKGFFSKLSSMFGKAIPYVEDQKAFVDEIVSIPTKSLVEFSSAVSRDKITADEEAKKAVADMTKPEEGEQSKEQPADFDVDPAEKQVKALKMIKGLDKNGQKAILNAMKNDILRVGKKV